MNALNSIILEGVVSKEAKLYEPVEGFKVCKFQIAVTRTYKNRNDESVEEVSHFDIEVYGTSAEFAEKKAVLGRELRVVGRLKEDTYIEASEIIKPKPVKVSRVYVIGEHIEYKKWNSKGEKND